MFNFQKFADDFNISVSTEGKNTQAGWLNIRCPLCNDPSNHMGFNTNKSYFNCWECGWHSIKDVIEACTATSGQELYRILELYSKAPADVQEEIIEKIPFSVPGSKEPTIKILRYLKNRNFDFFRLRKLWDLRSTNNIGADKFRIIAPIYFNNEIVSYQGRDVTDKSSMRYKACPKNKEIIHHKNILYGLDYTQPNSVIVVEGITDVWRLGPGAVSTFGIEYTDSQVRLLSRFANVYILFDPQAEEHGKKLADTLSAFTNTYLIINEEKDPAEYSDKQARKIMKFIA